MASTAIPVSAIDKLRRFRWIAAIVGALSIVATIIAQAAYGNGDEIQATREPSRSIDSKDGAEPDDPKLREAFRLINESIDLYGWDEPNPVALVRVVNYLQRLGKDRVIKTLRAYVRYAPALDPLVKPHCPDQQRLCWIIPLLFGPEYEDDKLPSLGRNPKSWSRGSWEELMISVEGELPFHKVALAGRVGLPDPGRGYLVEWADLHGLLRDEPIRPTDDPLTAADDLCERLRQADKPINERSREHIRLQARRSLEHLFPAARQKWNDRMDERDWKLLKEAAGKLKIRWDEKEQKYVAD
jgi:hypothetical protein